MRKLTTRLAAVRSLCGAAAFAMAFGALPATAQDNAETLADIRQEMSVLYVEIQRLKQELNTTGTATVNTGSGSVLDRLNTIEAELTRLTARTEELEFRIDQIVSDGTNRLGDLEFRLVELEGGDVSQLGETSTLGGGALPAVTGPAATPADNTGSGELAVGEQADFDEAVAALDAGSFEVAAQRFQLFTETYTGGPLTGQAHFLRGEALAGLGQTSESARAYLTSFSGDPNGPRAPDALYKLGTSLGELGQINEACVTLGEVAVRFPDSPVVAEAQAAMTSLQCN